MNTNVQDLIANSGLATDARLWEKQQPQRTLGSFVGPPIEYADVPAFWQSAKYVCEHAHDLWIVYPSGLTLPQRCVNWFWEFPEEVRQGSAEQAVRYALRRNVDPDKVWPVDPGRVHGTYVRYDDGDSGSYRLVPARAFPSWAWVTGGRA